MKYFISDGAGLVGGNLVEFLRNLRHASNCAVNESNGACGKNGRLGWQPARRIRQASARRPKPLWTSLFEATL
jgi:hypothetical protein